MLGTALQFEINVSNIPELVCFQVFNLKIVHCWICLGKFKNEAEHIKDTNSVGLGQRF